MADHPDGHDGTDPGLAPRLPPPAGPVVAPPPPPADGPPPAAPRTEPPVTPGPPAAPAGLPGMPPARTAEVPEPIALRSTALGRRSFAVLVVLYLGGAIAVVAAEAMRDGLGDPGIPFVSLVGFLVYGSVIVWSWLNLDNSRRVLATSRRRIGVSPWRGTFWWVSPVVVGIPLLVLARYAYDEHFNESDALGRDTDLLGAFMVAGAFLVLVFLWMRPYFYLGNVMKRIRGEASRFTSWFWIPLAAVVFIVGASFYFTILAGSLVFLLVAIAAPLCSFVLWSWLGWRALTAMEDTNRLRHDQLRRERAHFLAVQEAEAERRARDAAG